MGVMLQWIFLVLLGLGAVALLAHSEEAPHSSREAEKLPLTRVYADASGASHFADAAIPLELREFAPPAAPLLASPPEDSRHIVFLTLPGHWRGDWHPAPATQYLICLSGDYELKVSDGETRTFGPGSIVLLEDRSGAGHVVRNLSSSPVQLIALQK